MARTITTIDERSHFHPKRWTGRVSRPAQNWTLKLSAALWSFAPSQKPKRFRRFLDTFESILSRHRQAYEQLAGGPDR